jgi:hypothetical protein
LDDSRHRLDELTHGGLDVRRSTGAAYDRLTDGSRRLFRRLALVDSADFDVEACRSLLGVGTREAQDALEALVDARLIDVVRADAHSVRFRFHDLTYLFASERLAMEESALVPAGGPDRTGAWYEREQRSHVAALRQPAHRGHAAARADLAAVVPAGEVRKSARG